MFQTKVVGFKKIYLLSLSVYLIRVNGIAKITLNFLKWKSILLHILITRKLFETLQWNSFWLSTLWDMSW